MFLITPLPTRQKDIDHVTIIRSEPPINICRLATSYTCVCRCLMRMSVYSCNSTSENRSESYDFALIKRLCVSSLTVDSRILQSVFLSWPPSAEHKLTIYVTTTIYTDDLCSMDGGHNIQYVNDCIHPRIHIIL